MSLPKQILCWALVLGSLVSLKLYMSEAGQARAMRTDLAELQDVKYGLLDADVWVKQVSRIVNQRIDEFDLTEENRPVLKRQLENVLNRLFVEVESHLDAQRREEKTEVGRALRRLTDRIREILIPFEELRTGVPQYADAILDELGTDQAKDDIKKIVTAGIREAADQTFTETSRSRVNEILVKHDCTDEPDCQDKLLSQVNQRTQRLPLFVVLCVLAAVAVLALMWTGGKRGGTLPAGAVLAASSAILILLIGGIATPMIEIEAKIASLQLQVLGEPVVFNDQVLYFQSKSVIDVVGLLAATGEWDMIMVAGLIGLFSVIFPAAKLTAGFAYFKAPERLGRNPFIRFFALYSGKWSMADVMVVAIFMAYIGFEGLVASQLGALATSSNSLEILTTNGTDLKEGFFMFLAFCLAGLAFSTLLDQKVSGARSGAVETS